MKLCGQGRYDGLLPLTSSDCRGRAVCLVLHLYLVYLVDGIVSSNMRVLPLRYTSIAGLERMRKVVLIR